MRWYGTKQLFLAGLAALIFTFVLHGCDGASERHLNILQQMATDMPVYPGFKGTKYDEGHKLGQAVQSSDDELMSLVRQIAAGSDENSDAWRTLAAIPRRELISQLQTITQRLDSTDRRRISIAFVFCLLGHDYESNRDLIVKDMVRESNPDSDWELELIHRLISRGDSSLLPALFKMVPRADGAMAAALSGYLTYHVRNQPEQFLLGLKPQTKQLRMAVYWSLMHDELLTEADLATIRRHLESIPKANPTFAVAREMLSTLRRG